MLYSGGCHCGAVRYKVDLTIKDLKACNCSICGKRGHLLAFAPASAFTLEKGEDAQTDYQFGKKRIHHLFCKTCGVRPFAYGTGPDGTETAAINVRCIDGVDAHTLEPQKFSGKDL